MSMANYSMVKGYAALVGVVLVVVGLLGFIGNPLVGDVTATQTPLVVTGTVHNIVHLYDCSLASHRIHGPEWLPGDVDHRLRRAVRPFSC